MLKFLALLILTFLFSSSISTIYAADETTILLAEINEFRQENNLPPVKTDPRTCNFAALRAKEIAKEFSHDGFYERVKGKTMPYPSYKLVTENLARTTRKNAVKLWKDSPGHAANMLKQTSLVCVEKHGNFYAYEGLEI